MCIHRQLSEEARVEERPGFSSTCLETQSPSSLRFGRDQTSRTEAYNWLRVRKSHSEHLHLHAIAFVNWIIVNYTNFYAKRLGADDEK